MVQPVPVEAFAVVGVGPAREAAGNLAVAVEPVVGSLVVPLEVAGMEPALLEAVDRVVVLLAGVDIVEVEDAVDSLPEHQGMPDLLVVGLHIHLRTEKRK